MDIFISNFGSHVNEADLQELFEPFGSVKSVKVITNHKTGLSRGFAFIQMQSNKEAETAISRLNGIELEGRFISVLTAHSKADHMRKKVW